MQVLGCMSALVTPFKNGKLDAQTYEFLIKRQIEAGMDAVAPVGTTGESATLSHSEHKECIEIAVQTCKGSGVSVLAGAGSNATKEAIDLACFAQKIGADSLLCVTPYYNKPTQSGLLAHYMAIAESVEIPIMLYNVPSRTGVSLEPKTILELAKIPNIYAVKEASGNIERVVELNASNPNLRIFSGEDSLNYPILACGGAGMVSVTGNLLPKRIVALQRAMDSGNFEQARALNNALFPLNKALFLESNPIPIKAAMYIAGLLPRLEYRLPLVEPSKQTYDILQNLIQSYDEVQ